MRHLRTYVPTYVCMHACVWQVGEYILEEAIAGDFALVKAWKADTEGNLQDLTWCTPIPCTFP